MSETTLNEVEHLLDQLSPEEQMVVVERLARRLRQNLLPRRPQDLYGIWRNRFPRDFDLDTALGEIRNQWRHE